MGKASKRPGLGVVTSALCFLSLPFIYVAFTANSALVESWNNNLSKWRGELYSKIDDEPLKSLLQRLVRTMGSVRLGWAIDVSRSDLEHYTFSCSAGEDRTEFDSTGSTCQSELHTEVCLSSKLVRVNNNGLTLHFPSNGTTQFNRTVKPYARKEDDTAMQYVTPIRVFYGEPDPPACDFTHNVPSVVFSSGVTGNMFHEFSEILIPLFLTTRHFRSQVQFIVTDYRPWWVEKYRRVLTHLSDYEVMNSTEDGVHCFPGAVLGLKYHDNLALNPKGIPSSHSMSEFRRFLRESYDLKVTKVVQAIKKKPLALLISRPDTRKILNQGALVQLMEESGFRVVIADPELMQNLERFAEVVNSCWVMVGVHGAGFTSGLFLPDGAVAIQIIPLGLDWASATYFGEPAGAMGIRYLEYKIKPQESSLYVTYGLEDPVITDPMSVFEKGYKAARAVYVDGQNVEVDLARFSKTLLEAKRLLLV